MSSVSTMQSHCQQHVSWPHGTYQHSTVSCSALPNIVEWQKRHMPRQPLITTLAQCSMHITSLHFPPVRPFLPPPFSSTSRQRLFFLPVMSRSHATLAFVLVLLVLPLLASSLAIHTYSDSSCTR